MMIERLNAQDILNLLPADRQLKICVLDMVGSTNDYLFNLINAGSDIPDVVLAETQSAGKGRNGNAWNSPHGNIYLSLYKRFNCELNELYGLSLVIGIAVARVLQGHGLCNVKLKWPNDIYWNSRKMGGILIETRQHGAMVDAVIGLGLNVKDQTSPQFVCLEDALQVKIHRNKLVADLLNELKLVLDQFMLTGFDNFVAEWNRVAQTGSIIAASRQS